MVLLRCQTSCTAQPASLAGFFGSAYCGHQKGHVCFEKKISYVSPSDIIISKIVLEIIFNKKLIFLMVWKNENKFMIFKMNYELSPCAIEIANSPRSKKKWILWISILNLQVNRKENISKPKNSIHLWSMELIDIIQHTEHLLLNMIIGKKRYLKNYWIPYRTTPKFAKNQWNC